MRFAFDGCREVLYEEGPGGDISVTGLRLTKAGKEQIVTADAYIAALDVPGQTSPGKDWFMLSCMCVFLCAYILLDH